MGEEDRDKPWNFHTCKSCPYRTRSVFLMCKHVRQHGRKSKIATFHCESNATEMFECEHCLFETDLKVTLQHHLNVNHEEKGETFVLKDVLKCYKCKNCDLQTYSLLVMVKHMHNFNHVLDENFMEKHTQNKKNAKLLRFQCEVNTLERLKCKHCAFETDLKVKLQHHINVSHEAKKEDFALKNILKCYMCKNCDFQTYSLLLMTEHVDSLNHVINKNFIGIQSRDKKCGKRHEQCRRRYKCERCSYKSEKKRGLTKHVVPIARAQHLNWFECGWCTYKSLHKKHVKKHIKQKHNISWATCDRCSYTSQHWIYRKKVEDIIVWFKCSQCSYITKRKEILKQHVLQSHFDPVVKDIQWFACKNCSFKTITESVLTRHNSLKHCNVINFFKCDRCSFKTVTKHSLTRHISLKHVDWFNCPHCLFKTTTRDCLIKHISLKHDNKAYRFVCDYCSYLTNREDYFRSHIFMKHFETKNLGGKM